MDTDIYCTLAKQLRVRRLKAKLTLEKVSELADISTSFLAYIETGRKKPSLATVGKLACALNVSVAELFDDRAVSGIPDSNQKDVGKILKLLRGKNQAETQTIIAMVATLARKFPLK
ncbi:MAG: helix-turn-helix transcriptional regulator [Elusimicrobiales bacterium]|nr:helix-turn-helix transcriptional regulator [Elusimicrobiales bacterium]